MAAGLYAFCANPLFCRAAKLEQKQSGFCFVRVSVNLAVLCAVSRRGLFSQVDSASFARSKSDPTPPGKPQAERGLSQVAHCPVYNTVFRKSSDVKLRA